MASQQKFELTPELNELVEQLIRINQTRPKRTLGFPSAGLNPADVPYLYQDGYFFGCSGMPEGVDKDGDPIYPDPK